MVGMGYNKQIMKDYNEFPKGDAGVGKTLLSMRVYRSPKFLHDPALLLHGLHPLRAQRGVQQIDDGLSHGQGPADVDGGLLAVAQLLQLRLFLRQEVLDVHFLHRVGVTCPESREKARCSRSMTPFSCQERISSL